MFFLIEQVFCHFTERGLILQSSQKLDEGMLEKIETNYSKFIKDYTNFIIEYLLNMNYSNHVTEDLSEAEKQLAQSLF